MKIEKRTVAVTELRISRDKPAKIIGKILYNSLSEDLGFFEILKPGCFSESLRSGQKIFSLWSHDASKPLANTDSKTLILNDTETGLEVEIVPDVNISWGKDAVESVRRGDTAGLSFGFMVRPDGERYQDSVREIVAAELMEVSPCVFPAYSESKVIARNKKRGTKMDTIEILQKKYDDLKDDLQRIDPDFEDFQRSEMEEVRTAIRSLKSEREKNPVKEGRSITISETTTNGKPFSSMGEQLQAIRSAMSPSGQTDQRLHEVRAAGLNESISSEGGFLLQSDFSNNLLKKTYEASPLLPLLDRYQISSNGIELPAEDEASRADGSRHGGVRGYWTAEAGLKTASAPKFRRISLKTQKCVVIVNTTDELLQDASALDAYLNKVGPEEIGFKVQDAVVNGSGSGMPLGYLNADCCHEVAKESGQNGDTIVWENILSLWKSMPARNRKNAVWVINQSCESMLYSMSLAVGTGGVPVYLPAGGASKEPFATLLGRPVIPIEQAPTLGDAGDISFIDPKSYVFAEKVGGVQADVSIHVRFLYDESVYRFVYRCDGQPALQSTITSFSGETMSPFLKLAERA